MNELVTLRTNLAAIAQLLGVRGLHRLSCNSSEGWEKLSVECIVVLLNRKEKYAKRTEDKSAAR